MALSELMPLVEEAENLHRKIGDSMVSGYKNLCLEARMPPDRLRRLSKMEVVPSNKGNESRCLMFMDILEMAKDGYLKIVGLEERIDDLHMENPVLAPWVKAYKRKEFPDAEVKLLEIGNKMDYCMECYKRNFSVMC